MLQKSVAALQHTKLHNAAANVCTAPDREIAQALTPVDKLTCTVEASYRETLW